MDEQPHDDLPPYAVAALFLTILAIVAYFIATGGW